MVYGENETMFYKQFLQCCKYLSWSPEEAYCIRKLACINLRTTDVMEVYGQILDKLEPGVLYVDPKKLPEINSLLQDSSFWIYLFTEFLVFKDVSTCNGFSQTWNPIHQFFKSLEESQIFLPTWKETLILYILVNISCIPSANVCKQYVSLILKRDKITECQLFLERYADMRQTQEDFTNTFRFLINECFCENDTKKKTMYKQFNESKQRLQEFWNKKTLHANSGRIRLRERLKHAQNVAGRVVQSHETFDGFQETLLFSSQVSYSSRLAFYFLACQLNTSVKEIIENVKIKHGKSESICKLPVIQMPETRKIQELIAKIRYFGAPDQLLTEFHNNCLRSLSLTAKKTLSLCTIMQLYICIYQNENIWKDCWTNVLPLMNSQVIRDVDSFRKTHPVINPVLLTRAFATVI